MNVNLYNSLVAARNFFVEDERLCQEIKNLKEWMQMVYVRYDMPKQPESTYKGLYGILISWFFFPIGLIYPLYHLFKDSRKEKKYKAKLEAFKNTKEYIEWKNNADAEYRQYSIELANAQKRREAYYKTNYEKAVGFLPEPLRKKDSINELIYFVKNGANTLNEAWEYYAAELRELAKIEEQREARRVSEEKEKRRQETQERIAKSNEEIRDELKWVNDQFRRC